MRIIKYLLLLFILNSCSPQVDSFHNNSIESLHWLIGSWKTVSENTTTYEIWLKANDSILIGKSFAIKLQDTVFSETIAIKKIGNDLFYIPTVSNQNNGQPVQFKFIEFKNGEFIFENKEHDFPNRIIYKNPQPDFLSARIEGKRNGKFLKADFNFVKVK